MVKLHRICFWCGIEFNPGELAYQLHVQMAADFDGYIDGDSPDMSLESGSEAMGEARERTSEELTEEVYRERTFLACRQCAENAWKFITEPRHLIK